MNNTANPLDAALENLADITLGQTPSIWPLAWGWWVLIVASLLILSGAFWLLLNRIRKLKMKRRALQAVSVIDEHDKQALRKIHVVLRNAATHYLPLSDISGLQGNAWQGFLSAQASPHKKVTHEVLANIAQLESSLYTKTPSISVEEAKKSVSMWLRHCLPPSKSSKFANTGNSLVNNLNNSDTRSTFAKTKGVQHV